MTIAPYSIAGLIALLTVAIYLIEYKAAPDDKKSDPGGILKQGAVAGLAALLVLYGAQYIQHHKGAEVGTKAFVDVPSFASLSS